MTYRVKERKKRKMLAPSFLQSALQSIEEPDGHFRAECRVTNCERFAEVGMEVARI